MAEQAVCQTVLFPALFAKPLVATFDTPNQSSHGGAILLKAIDHQLGLTARLAACLAETRQAGKVEHDLPTLIRQRCFGLACGYTDANDAAQLRADPIHKLLVGRDPVTGPALASQPTLSRFENAVGPRELFWLTHALADVVIAQHQDRLGGADRPAHHARLRPHGRSQPRAAGARLLQRALRHPLLPAARGDAHFQRRADPVPGHSHSPARQCPRHPRGARGSASALPQAPGPPGRGLREPAVFRFLEAEGVEYLVAMASNARLEKRVFWGSAR